MTFTSKLRRLDTRWRWVAALLACVAANLVVFRPLFIFANPPQGLLRGVFERLDGTAVIAENAKQDPVMIPDMALDAARRVLMPPGTVALFQLVPGATFEVEAARGELPPYVVLGSRRTLTPGAEFDDDAELGRVRHVYVADGLTLTPTAGGDAALVAWDGARPWLVDARQLARLAAQCVAPETPARISVQASVATVTVRIGRCTTTHTWPVEHPPDLAMAVLAATTGARVAQSPTGFTARPFFAPTLAVAAAVVGAVRDVLVIAAFGPAAAVLASATLALSSIVRPFESMLVALLSVPIVIVASLVRRLLVVAKARAGGRVAVVVTSALLLVGLIYSKGNLWGLGGGTVASEQVNGGVTCLVLGYSMIAGEGMQPGSKGIFEHVRDDIPPCRNHTLRLAWPGERFSRVREELCGLPADRKAEAGYALFVGGTNDDFGWSVDLGNPVQRLGIRLWLARQFLLFRSWTATDLGPTMKDRMEVFAQRSAPDHAQDEAIAEGAACAARAGFRLHFFHDFHIYDLDGPGRTLARQELAARRQAAAASAGGVGIDLLERLGSQAGVTWFDDWVHFSSIGHAEAARTIADIIQRERSTGDGSAS